MKLPNYKKTAFEKDLEVTFYPMLHFSQHCEIVAKNANKKVGLIRSSFTYLDKERIPSVAYSRQL